MNSKQKEEEAYSYYYIGQYSKSEIWGFGFIGKVVVTKSFCLSTNFSIGKKK